MNIYALAKKDRIRFKNFLVELFGPKKPHQVIFKHPKLIQSDLNQMWLINVQNYHSGHCFNIFF
jgi:hypothetical protein